MPTERSSNLDMTAFAFYLALWAATLFISATARPAIAIKETLARDIIIRVAMLSSEGRACTSHQECKCCKDGLSQVNGTRPLVGNYHIGHSELGQFLLTSSNVLVTKVFQDADVRHQQEPRRERRDLPSHDVNDHNENGTGRIAVAGGPATSGEAEQSSWNQLSGIEKLFVGGGLIIWNGTGLGVFLKRLTS